MRRGVVNGSRWGKSVNWRTCFDLRWGAAILRLEIKRLVVQKHPLCRHKERVWRVAGSDKKPESPANAH